MNNPVLVNVSRGKVIENQHRGSIAVCDPDGRVLYAKGNVDALVYPRSAIKTLQALPLVESGAAKHFQLNDIELALACSSHSAEPMHIDAIRRWLARIDLDENSLECGTHAPLHDKTAEALLLSHSKPGRIHNNCSGKHAGMMTTAHFLGEDIHGYIEEQHPAQQRWFDVVGKMADVDMRRLPHGCDGCGIPVVAMPLKSIATAFARVAMPDDLPEKRAEALERLTSAIAANPFIIGGNGRFNSELQRHTGRRVIVKSGADGVFTAAIPEMGLGVALKIDDGSGEAAQVAMLAELNRLGALHADDLEALDRYYRVPVFNTRDVLTGYREPDENELLVELGK